MSSIYIYLVSWFHAFQRRLKLCKNTNSLNNRIMGGWVDACQVVSPYEAVLCNVYFVMWTWLIVDMLQTRSVRKTESIMKLFEWTLYVEPTFHKAGDFHKAGLAIREAFARSSSRQCYHSWASWKENIYLVSNKCACWFNFWHWHKLRRDCDVGAHPKWILGEKKYFNFSVWFS